MVINDLYRDTAASSTFSFDEEVLKKALKNIYSKDFHPLTDIEDNLFDEIWGTMNSATNNGFSQSVNPDDDFREAIKHNNAVFSAFKVHRMQKDMAARLLDSNGNLKPFEQWSKEVQPIADHQVGRWLKTEYDTAVIRAHQAADWRQFEREKDILPNLKWMPSTSIHPGADHKVFWGTVRPIDDKFWNEHRPGDRWNCKCSLSATDEPVTKVPDEIKTIDVPQKGLDSNPGKDGVIFSDNHPYFPDKCSVCPFNKGVKNKLIGIFRNARKNCYNCSSIGKKLQQLINQGGITADLAKLHTLNGSDYFKQLREIIGRKEFKTVKGEKNIYSVGGEQGQDYKPLINAAKKAVSHGYNVYMLPNPSSIRTADFIFERKGIVRIYDLKTIQGKGSVGSRLKESVGQTNRVLLNITTDYNPRSLAIEIKRYFESNTEALETLVFHGKKEISINRGQINEDFILSFIRRYNK